LLNFDLSYHLASGCIPCSEILMLIESNKRIFYFLECQILIAGSHSKKCQRISMQNWYNFDCLEIILICNSFLLLVVVEVIGVATQCIFKLKRTTKGNVDTVVSFIIEWWQVLYFETWRFTICLFIEEIYVFWLDQYDVRKIDIFVSELNIIIFIFYMF